MELTVFADRAHAARLLSDRLSHYKGQRPLVLGIPRGAVPMARIIADALEGDLDVVLVRKLRAPSQPELAIGAVDEAGVVLEGPYFDEVPRDYLDQEIAAQQQTIRGRRALYTRHRPPCDPAGRVVIVVDDGVATGASLLAALRALRARRPARLVAAIGVAPTETLSRLRREADEVVCVLTPEVFYAVGQFYADFSEVTDDDVVAALSAQTGPGRL